MSLSSRLSAASIRRRRSRRLRESVLLGASVLFGAWLGLAASPLLADELVSGERVAEVVEHSIEPVPAVVDRQPPRVEQSDVTPDPVVVVAPTNRRDGWASVVSQVADSVVSLKLSQLRSFDDVSQGASTATGFVVDADRGIVLTNRHVVGSGPVRLSATFQNQEQVDAVPLYRDPIHDFAFVRYDPAKLKYAKPASLALRPDKVRTGMNIRVIGADGGEQLSILPGTIARLDREVPSYGRYGYNDFNTFYLQAASGTSGGSSGSPVIDFAGDVVALNAAANSRTASSFFLPLWRVAHALDLLRENRPVPRGGLQTLFTQRPFHELARLGLDDDTETRVRRAEASTTGMLQVQQVIPGGAADDALDAGDILVSVDGTLVTDFVVLETLLDERIDSDIEIELIRQGERLHVQATVADLHALAPDRFVELGDAVLQDMSIQHARAMNLPQSGVVVMRPGYFFDRAEVPQGAVISAVDGQRVSGLDEFLSVVRASPRGAGLMIGYRVPGAEFRPELARLEIDTRWFSHRECERVDDVRFWNCTPVSLARRAIDATEQAVPVPVYADPLLDRVAPGLVRVDFHVPYPSDNVYARHFKGIGVIVDKAEGLVAVDRNTVPVGLGDADITVFGSQRVAGRVVYLHPRHNIALLQFDPSVLEGARYEPLKLAAVDTPMPDALVMVGLRADGTFRKHAFDDLSRVTIDFPAPGLPRFQQSALDVYSVPNVPPSLGGPIVDADGTVHALYMSFAFEVDREIQQREFAMPSYVIAEALEQYRAGRPWHSLDLGLGYRTLSLARERGMPDEWLQRFLSLDSNQRRVLYVERLVPATDAAEQLRSGDILLAIDGTTVSDLFLAETLSQKPVLALSVLRGGQVLELTVHPTPADTLGTQRLVSWAGALFQEPHGDIAYEKGVETPGVYIASTSDGSPALWDRLYRNRFVTAVDGRQVESLDEFIGLVSAKGQDEITRLSTLSMSGRKSIVTVQPEYHFWPTFEIKRMATGWRRFNILN